MTFNVDEKGYYGDFGGAYIPEMLYPNVENLRENYLKIMAEPSFKEEFDQLLKDYVGPFILPNDYLKNTIPRSILKEKTLTTPVRIR